MTVRVSARIHKRTKTSHEITIKGRRIKTGVRNSETTKSRLSNAALNSGIDKVKMNSVAHSNVTIKHALTKTDVHSNSETTKSRLNSVGMNSGIDKVKTNSAAHSSVTIKHALTKTDVRSNSETTKGRLNSVGIKNHRIGARLTNAAETSSVR